MTLAKIKLFFAQAQDVFNLVQQFVSVKGNLYVDAFALVVLIRMLAPLKGFAPLTIQEAGLWGVTIAAFAASKTGGSND